MFLRLIYFKKKLIKTLLTRWLMSGMKHQNITLLSDVNVPVRFRAQHELSIANHSPRWTVSRLKCGSDTISSWFENHQPQKTKISSVIYAPFIQNSKQMASRLTVTTSFPRVFFNSCNFQGNFQAFRLPGPAAPIAKTDLIFPAFSSRFVDFAVQFCELFSEERRSSQVWQWRDFSRPITILCYA